MQFFAKTIFFSSLYLDYILVFIGNVPFLVWSSFCWWNPHFLGGIPTSWSHPHVRWQSFGFPDVIRIFILPNIGLGCFNSVFSLVRSRSGVLWWPNDRFLRTHWLQIWVPDRCWSLSTRTDWSFSVWDAIGKASKHAEKHAVNYNELAKTWQLVGSSANWTFFRLVNCFNL